MTATPRISVVTACRNAADFIEQSLQSVLGQDLPGVEHVVIDGGSTDGTADIVERHSNALSYWHSRADRGIGHAFNLGVEKSRGEWLLFLNADDYFSRRDSLGLLADRAAPAAADVVYGRVLSVSRDGSPRVLGAPSGWRYSPWGFLLKDLIPHPAALTARAYFDRVGPFREDLGIGVDYEHYLRSYRTLRTVFVPEVLTHMRVGGLSHDRRASLEEMLRAQVLNRVLPPFSHALLRSFVRSKAAAGRVLRALHGQG